MLTQVTNLTRRAKGGVNRKDSSVSADVVRFGRSTGSEVFLADLRVPLEAAELAHRDGGFFLGAVGGGTIRVNGASTTGGLVKPGDKIDIGPYQVVIEAPPKGQDFALTVELVSPLGDDLQRLQAASKLSLIQAGMSRRRWAWIGFLTVLTLFLVVPMVVFFTPGARQSAKSWPITPDTVWDSGPLSSGHRNIANDCGACHQFAFIMVRDDACLACHTGNKAVTHHFDIKTISVPSLDETRCATCHKEHNGPHGAITRAEALCTDCHLDLKRVAANTTLLDVGSFGTKHPEFRPTVVVDAAKHEVARISLAATPKPTDKSNFNFSHAVHLEPKGVVSPVGLKKMVCADCHKPDKDQLGMAPINYELHCADCHTLKFDGREPKMDAPHGSPERVESFIRQFYAQLALRGGFGEITAPEVVRRRPGEPLPRELLGDAAAWADEQAKNAMELVFDPNRGCGYCHVVKRDLSVKPTKYDVPIYLLDSFMPKAKFSHGKHATFACADCHEAAKSSESSDLLLPGIQSCQACHGGEHSWSKVASTCIDCHDFHIPRFGPMRSPAAMSSRVAQ